MTFDFAKAISSLNTSIKYFDFGKIKSLLIFKHSSNHEDICLISIIFFIFLFDNIFDNIFKCFEKDNRPVDTEDIFRGFEADKWQCEDVHGNKYQKGDKLISCCEYLM